MSSTDGESLNAEISTQGGRVLAVSIDDDARNVQVFAKRENMRLPVFLDGSGGLARDLDLRSVPMTLVLDRAGNIAYSGASADAASLDALVAGCAAHTAVYQREHLVDPIMAFQAQAKLDVRKMKTFEAREGSTGGIGGAGGGCACK